MTSNQNRLNGSAEVQRGETMGEEKPSPVGRRSSGDLVPVSGKTAAVMKFPLNGSEKVYTEVSGEVSEKMSDRVSREFSVEVVEKVSRELSGKVSIGRHLVPKDPKAPMANRLKCVIEQAVEYARECGVGESDAAKFRTLFYGQDAACALIKPEIYICCVNEGIRHRDVYLGHTTGNVSVPARGNRPGYTVELRPLDEDETQWVFVVGVSREGGVRQNGESEFMTYSLVFPQTNGGLPLVIACDLRREQSEDDEGDIFQLVPSRRIYMTEVRDWATREPSITNRLSTVRFATNLMNLATRAAFDAGFPFDKSRVNRLSVSERRALFNRGRFSVPPQPTQPVMLNQNQIETIDDPFATVTG